MSGTAITKSVVTNEPGGRKRDEIFVDVIEKISVTFDSRGYILTSEIDGTIQMKSYLTSNPEIRLALDEDLSIGISDYGGGEFPVMNYRITQAFKTPFRISTLIEETGPLKAEVTIEVRAEFDSNINANTVLVQMPLPAFTARVKRLDTQLISRKANRRLKWGIKRLLVDLNIPYEQS
ncbi:AP-4 complex subunit mu-like [Lathyrus oleraceus]|uniref:AP-4 complex subunit mu-like n=1 Tax=Pisum sativum TaxID=3888 RepID=UPI0021D34BD6|nr:AP-4 complex subunit mu-like [Pisum sativum]